MRPVVGVQFRKNALDSALDRVLGNGELIGNLLVRVSAGDQTQHHDFCGRQALTPAEVVVLRLIAGGNANKQIADQLAISKDTVKGRVKSIFSKLDANDRTHAAIIGLKRGIIEL